MALTLKTLKEPRLFRFYTLTEVAFDSSYLEGGEVFTPAQAGLATINMAFCTIINGSEEATVRPTNCYYSEEKLHLIDSATGKEVASTKNMEKVKVLVFAFGDRRAK